MDKNLFSDLCGSIKEAGAMKSNEGKSKYIGITYPNMFDNKLVHRLWKRFMCKDGKHLFDEVFSYWGVPDDPQHYLYCDACGLEVHISNIILTP